MPKGILTEPTRWRRIRDGRQVLDGERLRRAIAEGRLHLAGLVLHGAVDVCRVVLHLLLLATGLLLLVQLLLLKVLLLVVLLLILFRILLVLLLLVVLLVLLALLVRAHVHVDVALCGGLHVGLLRQVLFGLLNSFHWDSMAPEFLVFGSDLIHPLPPLSKHYSSFALRLRQTFHLCLVVQISLNLQKTFVQADRQHAFAASLEVFVYFRITRSHEGELNSAGFSAFPVFFVAGLRLVFSGAVAHKGVFLGPLPVLLEHQHPLVVGVGRSGRKEERDTLTFRLGLLHLLLGQTLATPEPCGGRERGLRLGQKQEEDQRFNTSERKEELVQR